MDPIPTLDVLLNDAEAGKDRLTRAVESAIAAALGDLAAIEAFDKATAPEHVLWFDRPVATAVRAQYEAWVPAAEGLLARSAAAAARGGPDAGVGPPGVRRRRRRQADAVSPLVHWTVSAETLG